MTSNCSKVFVEKSWRFRTASSALVVAVLAAGQFVIAAPASAKTICHDEQQQKCVKWTRWRYGPPQRCIQYATVTVSVCKNVIDVNPAGVRPRVPRGDPRLKTQQ